MGTTQPWVRIVLFLGVIVCVNSMSSIKRIVVNVPSLRFVSFFVPSEI